MAADKRCRRVILMPMVQTLVVMTDKAIHISRVMHPSIWQRSGIQNVRPCKVCTRHQGYVFADYSAAVQTVQNACGDQTNKAFDLATVNGSK